MGILQSQTNKRNERLLWNEMKVKGNGQICFWKRNHQGQGLISYCSSDWGQWKNSVVLSDPEREPLCWKHALDSLLLSEAEGEQYNDNGHVHLLKMFDC